MKPRWNPEVTLGHVLLILSWLGAAVLFFVYLKRDVDMAKLERNHINERVIANEKQIQKITDSQWTQTRNLDKVIILLDEHMKSLP